jgi:hypothetical protein
MREILFEYEEPLAQYPCYLKVIKEIDSTITISVRSPERDSNAPGISRAGNSGCVVMSPKNIAYLIIALGKLIPKKETSDAPQPPHTSGSL